MQTSTLLTVALGAALAGCATVENVSEKLKRGASVVTEKFNTITGRTNESDVSKKAIEKLNPGPFEASSFAVGEEIDIARRRASGLGLVHLPVLTDYYNALFTKLKQASGLTKLPGRVFLSADPGFGAESTPDGNVYISLGQARALQCEDEVVALLGHELGHIVLGHFDSDRVKQISQYAGYAASFLGNAGIGLPSLPGLPGAPGIGKLQGLPLPFGNPASLGNPLATKSPAPTTLDKTSDDNPFPGIIPDNAIGRGNLTLNTLLFPAWGRSQEREADRFALDMTQKLGYTYGDGVKTWLERVTKADEEAAEARAKLKSAPIDIRAHVARWIDDRKRDTHGKDRPELIEPYFEKHYEAGPRGKADCKSYAARLESREAKRTFDAYDAAFDLADVLGKPDRKEAAEAARKIEASGVPLDRHPVLLNQLARYYTTIGRAGVAETHLARALKSPEPTWHSHKEAAIYASRGGRKNAETAIHHVVTGFNKFAEPPFLLPEMISYHRWAGNEDEAKRLIGICVAKAPEFKDECTKPPRRPNSRS